MPENLWLNLAKRLQQGGYVAVATIAEADGSVPRSAGAKMLVDQGGHLYGTLGGGLAEARALYEAAETLADGQQRRLKIDMSGSAAGGTDLICGGWVDIFIQRYSPEHAPVFDELARRIRLGQSVYVLTRINEDENAPAQPPMLLDAAAAGDEDLMAKAALAIMPEGACFLPFAGRKYFLEPVYARTRLVLAGGGHVALATARIADMADFAVTVLDDRPEFASPARFPWLPQDRVVVVPEFKDCLSEGVLGFPVTERCYVAILTRGHAFDGEVLAQALRTGAGYIGMIGSRRKREAVYGEMRGLGFGEKDLGRVHSPIGLPLGGDTPAEIAVSIVAEIIRERAKVAASG